MLSTLFDPGDALKMLFNYEVPADDLCVCAKTPSPTPAFCTLVPTAFWAFLPGFLEDMFWRHLKCNICRAAVIICPNRLVPFPVFLVLVIGSTLPKAYQAWTQPHSTPPSLLPHIPAARVLWFYLRSIEVLLEHRGEDLFNIIAVKGLCKRKKSYEEKHFANAK